MKSGRSSQKSHSDKLWLTEAKRRRDEVRSGKVKTIPGDEAIAKVRKAVRRPV
jgi:hypothetical protein